MSGVATPVFDSGGVTLDGATQYLLNSTADWRSGDSSGAVAFWFKRGTSGGIEELFATGDEGTDVHFMIYRFGADDKLSLLHKEAGSSETVRTTDDAVADTAWHHTAIVSTGTAWLIYLDGDSKALTIASGSNSGDWFAEVTLRDNVTWGAVKTLAGVGSHFNGSLQDGRVYDRAISATEIASLYAQGRPNANHLNGFFVMPLTATYSSGTTAFDMYGARDGTASGTPAPTYTSDGVVLDGVDQVVTVGDDDAFSFGNTTTDSAFSICVWVNATDATTFPIIEKSSSTTVGEWGMWSGGADTVAFYLFDLNTSNYIVVVSDAVLPQGSWVHLCGSYAGGSVVGDLTLYKDGAAWASSPSSAGSYTAMHATADSVTIGERELFANSFANGTISGAQLFARELSSTEVAALYAQGRPLQLPPVGTGAQLSVSSLQRGLTFSAPLDDKNLQTSVLATDVSSGHNHATTDNGTATYSGAGYECDGSTDSLEFPGTGIYNATAVSMAMRFTPDFAAADNTQNILFDSSDGSRYLVLKQNDAASNILAIYLGNTLIENIALGTYGSAWNANQENTIIVTGDDTANLTNVYLNGTQILTDDATAWANANPAVLYVGSNFVPGAYFDGSIRDLRIYNRILTASERAEYEAGTVTGVQASEFFSMPLTNVHSSGVTAYDIIGANDGTGSGTPAPTFSADGVVLDGVDQVITVADNDALSFTDGSGNDTPASWSAWVNLTDATNAFIINKDSGANREFQFGTLGDDKFALGLLTDGANFLRLGTDAVITEGAWVHLAATYSGSELVGGILLYVDGIVAASTSAGSGSYTGMANTAEDVFIGRRVSAYANGTISNARLWSRELSAAEVLEIYNQGR